MVKNQQRFTIQEIHKSLLPYAKAITDKPVCFIHNAPCASTDGSTIRLPALDPKDGLALVIIYGHTIHELAHVRLSNFDALEGCQSFHPLINSIEDVRVDKLQETTFPGARFLRTDLLEKLGSLGRLPVIKPTDDPMRLLSLAVYWGLTEKIHGYRLDCLPYRQTKEVFCSIYGEKLYDRILRIATEGARSASTYDVVACAKKILNVFMPEAFAGAPEGFNSSEEKTESGKTRQRLAARKLNKFLENHFKNCDDIDLAKASEEVINSRKIESESESSEPVSVWTVKRDNLKAVELGSFVEEAKDLCGGYTNKIRRLLQAKTYRDTLCGRSGRTIAYSALSRVSIGDSRVFKKEETVIKQSAVCAILLDRSGSMARETLHKAKLAAYATSELFDSIEGCSCACYAFPGVTRRTLLEVKGFNDSCRKTVSRFAAVRAFGFTPILESLTTAAVQLSIRPEVRKIILMITDGLTAEEEEVQKTAESLEKQGFEILCLNIGSEVGRLFKYQETIHDENDLAPSVYRLLSAYFGGKAA